MTIVSTVTLYLLAAASGIAIVNVLLDWRIRRQQAANARKWQEIIDGFAQLIHELEALPNSVKADIRNGMEL